MTNTSRRDDLILSHLPQVELLAKRLHRRCPQVELADLIQVGTVGLIGAVDRFDPTRGCLLKTIAEHKIRGALLDYLRQIDPLPRNVRRFQKQRDAMLSEMERIGAEIRHDWIAEQLGVSAAKNSSHCRTIAAAEPISIEDSPRAWKLAG